MSNVPSEHYTKAYFEKWNYADRGLGRFSMYWFARRYYATLVKRFAPTTGATCSRWGVGLGIYWVCYRMIINALELI